MITASLYGGPMDGIDYPIPSELLKAGVPPLILEFEFGLNKTKTIYSISSERVIGGGLYLIRYKHDEYTTKSST